MEYYSAIVATVALIISFANFWRDRSNVKVSSSFYEGSEWDPLPEIRVVMANRGRRSVILRMIGGADDKDNWARTVLDYDKGGIRLGEHERWEHTIRNAHTVDPYAGQQDIFFTHMWIEDSLGVRRPIPRSYEYVRKLQATLLSRPSAAEPSQRG